MADRTKKKTDDTPRTCEHCRHWRRESTNLTAGWSVCELVTTDRLGAQKKARIVSYGLSSSASLLTAASFACAQFAPLALASDVPVGPEQPANATAIDTAVALHIACGDAKPVPLAESRPLDVPRSSLVSISMTAAPGVRSATLTVEGPGVAQTATRTVPNLGLPLVFKLPPTVGTVLRVAATAQGDWAASSATTARAVLRII